MVRSKHPCRFVSASSSSHSVPCFRSGPNQFKSFVGDDVCSCAIFGLRYLNYGHIMAAFQNLVQLFRIGHQS